MPEPNPKNILITLALLLMALCVLYLNLKVPDKPPTAIEIAQVNPEVKREKKVEVVLETPNKSVRVYKPSAKARIQLPKETLDDATKHVTASSVVKPSEKRKVITQVLDISTGTTQVYVSEAPQPWIAFENRGQLSLDYGYRRGNSTPLGRINLRHDLLQIKQVHLGYTASGYTDGDYFVGIGGSYRW